MKKISLFYLLFALSDLISMPLSCTDIEINLKDMNNRERTWKFKEKDTIKISEFKGKHENKIGLCQESIQLMLNSNPLEPDKKSFQSHNITDEDIVFVVNKGLKHICVKIKQRERKLIDFEKINKNPKDLTISDLKKEIQAQCKNQNKEQYNPSNQILRFKGKELTDKLTLFESKIEWGSIVQLSFKNDLRNKMILHFIVSGVFIFTIAYILGFFSSSETEKDDEVQDIA